MLRNTQKKCVQGEKETEERDRMGENKNMNVFLDLDSTILNSVEPEEEKKLPPNVSKRLKKFDMVRMGGDYNVYLRPGMEEFLTFVFTNFNVCVWTAADKDYMAFILRHIIMKNNPTRKLDVALWDKHCSYSLKRYGAIKDLRYVWDVLRLRGYHKHNTFLIDDLPETWRNDRTHVIKIKPFEALDKKATKDDAFSMVKRRLLTMKEKVNKTLVVGYKKEEKE